MRFSRRVIVLASGGVIGALVTVGAVSALSVATANTPSVTYFACLNAGTLSHVGTTAPTCTSPATRISWNSVGPQGVQGPKGATGARGAAGLNGSGVRSGATVPPGACKTGDTFVAITSPPGEVYKCVSSAWVDSGESIRGPQGTDGTNGSSVLTSSGAPSGTCTTGDSDVDVTTGEVYNCVGSAWQDSGGSIQGPQGVQGVQGPAGISTGVTFGKVATIPIDTGQNNPVIVLTAPAVHTSGIYYLTSSVTMQVASSDSVACAAIPNQIQAQTSQFGAPSNTISTALVVNGALSLDAGQAPSIECIDANSDASTQFLEGSINATLISSSNASSSNGARTNRFPLKIVGAGK